MTNQAQGAPGQAPSGYGYPAVPLAIPYGRPPTGPHRPGSITTAAVLAFIQSGLLLVSGVVLMMYGLGVTRFGIHPTAFEWSTTGMAMVLAGGLLIAGGVQLLAGRPTLSRWAAVASWFSSLYLLVGVLGNDPGNGIVAVIYLTLPVVVLSLSSGLAARNWLGERTAAAGR